MATGNAHKLAEIRAILSDDDFELCSLEGLAAVSFPDEGDQYQENAIEKARCVAQQLGEIAIADDSGLEVDALGGEPGPHSARYGGPGLDDAGRVERLLAEIEGVAAGLRTARFVCVAALAAPAGELMTVRRECEGRIAAAPAGSSGFGYDPVFLPAGEERAMAELSAAEKNQISHRALAFRALMSEWRVGRFDSR